MKSGLLLSALFLIGFSVVAQKETMPSAAAKTAFGKTFPGSSKVKWSKEKNDYEVEFALQGKQLSAVYDNRGILKETEEDIKIAALPSAAAAYVKAHYPKGVIKEVAKITLPNGTITYEAEVNKKDLIFDANGIFVREVKDAD